MKKILGIILCVIMALSLAACSSSQTTTKETKEAPKNPVIRLSTTTSVNDSGLLPYLQPVFEADTGYKLEITSAGTGAAVAKGTTGDADCLLVHAKDAEETFIADGFGVKRIPFMYNYFVIVGPAGDPAGIAGSKNAAEAFKKIAESKSTFISRGDDSGTNKAELKIWAATGIAPNPATDSWYISAGDGMGACITMASQKQAYVLTDKATYLANAQRDTLKVLLGKSDDMKNTYSLIAVNPDKWPDTNIDGANAFIKWMTSEKALKLIDKYGVKEYGEQLFFTDL